MKDQSNTNPGIAQFANLFSDASRYAIGLVLMQFGKSLLF